MEFENLQTNPEAKNIGQIKSPEGPLGYFAMLVGNSAGYASRFLNFFRGIGRKRVQKPEPFDFERVLKQAIWMEIRKKGIVLTDEEVEGLVRKVFQLLENLLNGSGDAISSNAGELNSGSLFREFLTPMINSDKELSESKKDILKRIFEENVRLQKV